jgi:hypothetical protein
MEKFGILWNSMVIKLKKENNNNINLRKIFFCLERFIID